MSELNLDDLIHEKDFKKLRHIVYMRNESSHTVVSNPDEIRILAIEVDGVYLKVPKNSSKEGQGITLFFLEAKKENFSKNVPVEGTIKGCIECVGKIMEEELFNEEPDRKVIKIDLTQTDAKTWKLLTDQYSKVEDVLEKMYEEGSVA